MTCSPHCRQTYPFTRSCVTHVRLLGSLFCGSVLYQWLQGPYCLSTFILHDLSWLTALHFHWFLQYPLSMPISRVSDLLFPSPGTFFPNSHVSCSAPPPAPVLFRSLITCHLIREGVPSSLPKVAAFIPLHCLTLLYSLHKH